MEKEKKKEKKEKRKSAQEAVSKRVEETEAKQK